MIRIKSNIKALADAKGVSLRKLAEDIGIGFESVRRFANDIAPNYSRDLMEKFCVYFQCDHSDLFETEKLPKKLLTNDISRWYYKGKR